MFAGPAALGPCAANDASVGYAGTVCGPVSQGSGFIVVLKVESQTKVGVQIPLCACRLPGLILRAQRGGGTFVHLTERRKDSGVGGQGDGSLCEGHGFALTQGLHGGGRGMKLHFAFENMDLGIFTADVQAEFGAKVYQCAPGGVDLEPPCLWWHMGA